MDAVWMPHVRRSCGEGREAVGDNFEGREVDETTRTTTSVSARSASHDHWQDTQPDKSDKWRPADTTDDDERHPDESTQLPDEPIGMGGAQIEGESKAPKENNQHTLTDEGNAPGRTHPLPTSLPARTARQNQPPSVKLEGERGKLASYDAAPEAVTPGPSEDVDEVTNQLKKLWIESEPERVDKKKSASPGMHTKAKHAVHDLGGNTHVPGNPHSIPGCPRGDGTKVPAALTSMSNSDEYWSVKVCSLFSPP